MTDSGRSSMGDLFNQRRAGKTQQRQRPQQPPPPPPAQSSSSSSAAAPSFLDIQAEQDRERRRYAQKQQQGSSTKSSVGSSMSSNRSFRSDRRGGGADGTGSFRRSSKRDYSHLPLEQGCIASLKDAFGFIYCADRPEQVFFHYSELTGCHSDDLQVDDEVEFRIGPSPRDNDKMAAFEVAQLERGTIEWEVEDDPGVRFQGLVERPVRSERGSSQLSEGTIRMLVVPDDGETTDEEIAAAATGPLIRYNAADYTPEEKGGDGGTPTREFRRFDSSVSTSSRGRLGRNDLVEFTLVTERRTGNKMARSISLVQSEKERQRLAREKELMANASLEQGVVTSLKTDYGFLRSNRRREEVYFHYSNVSLPDGDEDEEKDKADNESDDVVLKEGQDMEFLVLTEPGTDGRRDRLSAREVKFLPKGSVVFQKLVAEGVTGVVTRPPHPQDAGYSQDFVGRVQLSAPLDDVADDGNVTAVNEVLFYSKDSPGGTFSANRDGSSVGIWVREGDTLLFDVMKDVVDGSFRVAPTKHAQPTAIEASKESKNGKEANGSQACEKAVRLVAASLAGRAEGVVHAIKDGYGFISCAERPVDAYFRLYEVMPDHIQEDLRRNMGIETGDDVPQLELGAQIEFDLSLQGIVAIGNHRARNRVGGSGERENLKAQRLLLLPKSTFVERKVIAKDAKGVVSREDQKQTYAGFIELEDTYKSMSYEERHPLVAKLVRSMLEDGPTRQSSIVFHDVQSVQEDDVVVFMVEELGKASLSCSHIPVAGLSGHPGRLCISKASVSAAEDTTGESGNDGVEDPEKTADAPGTGAALVGTSSRDDDIATAESSHSLGQSSHSRRGKKKRRPKVKDIKSVHYDRHCLAKESLDDVPPGLGDSVLCDIVQSRRSGLVEVTNIRVVERSESGRASTDGDARATAGVGIVAEVVGASKFGFISLLDENASRREMLFFQFSSVVEKPSTENSMAASLHSSSKDSRGDTPVKRGDEVKFDIVVGKKGKRTAINIHVVPRGTLNIPTKADRNACRGLILMEPSHTSLSTAKARQTSRSPAAKGGGRWDNVESEQSPKGSSSSDAKAEGRILLIKDPINMFAIRSAPAKDSKGTEPTTAEPQETGNTEKEVPKEEAEAKKAEDSDMSASSVQRTVGMLLSYKNGAIAIQGVGASSSANGSNVPRRGDLVSFVKTRNGRGLRDIRIVERGAATFQRGRLEDIELASDGESSSLGTAKFIAATEGEEEFGIDLADVVSCDVSVLRDKESVEGILHDGKIYGVCRTSDLYIGSKLGSGHKERPKLNLTVRKELKQNLGGKIMAQSMMAKGPDGTNGFATGWTTRVSQYAPPPPREDSGEAAEETTRTEDEAVTPLKDVEDQTVDKDTPPSEQ